VKLPRFRIAWLMVAVAIAALDFGVMREVVGSRSTRNIGLLLGILPMANVLTVGMLIKQRRPGSLCRVVYKTSIHNVANSEQLAQEKARDYAITSKIRTGTAFNPDF
jgi:hypothetical protein